MDTDNNDNLSPIRCKNNDIISIGENTFKIDKLRTAVRKSCNQKIVNQLHENLNYHKVDIETSSYDHWFQEGVDCEILTLGATKWRKGKMKFKLSLEFYVEEEEDNTSNETTEESPLDDIRRQISEATP